MQKSGAAEKFILLVALLIAILEPHLMTAQRDDREILRQHK
jgi:hypothetical protein